MNNIINVGWLWSFVPRCSEHIHHTLNENPLSVGQRKASISQAHPGPQMFSGSRNSWMGGVSHYLNTERVYTAFPALKKCLKLCQHCTASPHSHSGLEQAAACTASSAYSLPASAPEAFYIGTWDFSLFLVTAWSQQCSWKQLLHIWGVSNFRRIQRTGRQVPSLRT